MGRNNSNTYTAYTTTTTATTTTTTTKVPKTVISGIGEEDEHPKPTKSSVWHAEYTAFRQSSPAPGLLQTELLATNRRGERQVSAAFK